MVENAQLVGIAVVVDVIKVADNTMGATMATVAKDIIFNKGLGLSIWSSSYLTRPPFLSTSHGTKH